MLLILEGSLQLILTLTGPSLSKLNASTLMGSATKDVISMMISSSLAKLGTPCTLIQADCNTAEAAGSTLDLVIMNGKHNF